MNRKIIFSLSLAVLIASCASYNPEKYQRENREKVLPRASFEMGCPKENINISYLNSYEKTGFPLTIGAEGCGKKLVYIYVHRQGWVLNSDGKSSKSIDK